MPFNDIFGMPTPDNPRTRMVMPYGNPDIDKLKHILTVIREQLLNAYSINPNIETVIFVQWDIDKKTTT